MKYFFRFLKYSLLIAVAVFIASFYYKYQLVGIKDIHPDSLNYPVQTPVDHPYNINFKDGKYSYTITPVDNYKITGVVVGKYDYNPADDNVEKVMRYDLCMVWGRNVSDKVYLAPNINFSQKDRFCGYNFSGSIDFHPDQFSNSHIITTNESVLVKLKTIRAGDEVSITGQLVNISAVGTGDKAGDDKFIRDTSTTREDTGAGACEIIYVESLDILTPVHKNDDQINDYALWVIIVAVSLFLLRAITFVLFSSPKRNNGRNQR